MSFLCELEFVLELIVVDFFDDGFDSVGLFVCKSVMLKNYFDCLKGELGVF